MRTPSEFKICGKVKELETKKGYSGLIVEALDKDFRYDDRLGSVVTDKDGNFEIQYDKSDFKDAYMDKQPDIYLRVKTLDGEIIHTTEDKIRYKADKTEIFNVDIPQHLEKYTKGADYKIDGKVDPKLLKELPEGLALRAYAVRDRRVLGSSPIEDDGSFNIKYKYGIYEKNDKRLAIGPSLVIGPNLPEDEILKEKFPFAFMPPEKFKETKGEWFGTVPAKTTKEMLSPSVLERFIQPWWKIYCHEWRPCLEILSCSSISGGLCYNQHPLPDVRVRIYEVRWPMLIRFGTKAKKYTTLVAEGDTDEFGYFRTHKTICKKPTMVPFFTTLGYIVEVGQVIDGMFHSIYRDPDDQLRDLKNDLCEEVHIEESEIIEPEGAEGLLTGDTFKLTRIGNIPVGYINQDPTSSFHGYANSSLATDSATLKVVDSAFYRGIKIYANIGAGIVNTVKFYRIKCSYEVEGILVENYVQVPFYNLRESTPAEKPISGPYKTEYMGPTDSTYAYPNPYEMAVDKQWVYKGLIMKLDTRTLPLPYGKFTFAVEVLDAAKNPVTVDDPDDLACTILVDNTPPTGAIADIIGPSGSAAACGFLKLPDFGTYTACDGNTRKQVNGRITVPFSAQDEHDNIYKLTLGAHFGDVCDAPVTLVGPGQPPEISMTPGATGCGGTSEYRIYSDVPAVQHPNWDGDEDYCASKDKVWDECAYQFRLTIHKRLTNGEIKYPWWNFTKHITITHL
ncbi:MAG: hypothetical protein K8R64_00660 [Methanosarcinaceae archaeon]|nr:hypothetical protein [Methanosarcinaceae archaeon]